MNKALIVAVSICAATPLAAKPMHLVERATTDATAHIGKDADNRGDVLTFANDVYDGSNAKKIGTDQGYCIRVVVGKSFECTWTTTLAGGQITVEGPFLDAGDSTLAVTGGTGKYASVRGEMKLHARDAKGSEYDFIYLLK
ncbi:MAG TPA: allene oxide cyclase family protein [Rhizomicrobium sp.]|nr:allene oxide cyclase family protein [Rhizomicrobium sp.]